MLGIYTPNTFPYQIRTDIFFFGFYKFLIIITPCLELVHYSTLHNTRFHPLESS